MHFKPHLVSYWLWMGETPCFDRNSLKTIIKSHCIKIRGPFKKLLENTTNYLHVFLSLTEDGHSCKLAKQLHTNCEKGDIARQNNHENFLNFVLQHNNLLCLSSLYIRTSSKNSKRRKQPHYIMIPINHRRILMSFSNVGTLSSDTALKWIHASRKNRNTIFQKWAHLKYISTMKASSEASYHFCRCFCMLRSNMFLKRCFRITHFPTIRTSERLWLLYRESFSTIVQVWNRESLNRGYFKVVSSLILFTSTFVYKCTSL